MDERAAHPAGSPRRHETTDADIRGIVRFAIGLFTAIVVAMAVCAWVFNYFAAHQALGPPASPFENTRELPPEGMPRLQVKPPLELRQYEKEQGQELHSYGWVDRKNGVAHIPIERAMDLLLQRGLPVQSAPPENEVLQPGAVPQYETPKGYTPTR